MFRYNGYTDEFRRKVVNNYKEQCEAFMELIASDDHAKHYKAVMVLLTFKRHIMATENEFAKLITVDCDGVLTLLDDIVMRWHAKDVLVREELPKDKLPNPKYEKWFVGDERFDVGAE